MLHRIVPLSVFAPLQFVPKIDQNLVFITSLGAKAQHTSFMQQANAGAQATLPIWKRTMPMRSQKEAIEIKTHLE